MGSHPTLFRTSSMSKAFENDLGCSASLAFEAKKIFSVTRAYPCQLCESIGMLAPWTIYLFYTFSQICKISDACYNDYDPYFLSELASYFLVTLRSSPHPEGSSPGLQMCTTVAPCVEKKDISDVSGAR